MRTQSALNQPFYAEIELFDVKTDELDTVKVRLASADAFRDAGAERPHFLTRLRFYTDAWACWAADRSGHQAASRFASPISISWSRCFGRKAEWSRNTRY